MYYIIFDVTTNVKQIFDEMTKFNAYICNKFRKVETKIVNKVIFINSANFGNHHNIAYCRFL